MSTLYLIRGFRSLPDGPIISFESFCPVSDIAEIISVVASEESVSDELLDSDSSCSGTGLRKPHAKSARKMESFGCKTTPLLNRRGVRAKLNWPLTEEAIFYKNKVFKLLSVIFLFG